MLFDLLVEVVEMLLLFEGFVFCFIEEIEVVVIVECMLGVG